MPISTTAEHGEAGDGSENELRLGFLICAPKFANLRRRLFNEHSTTSAKGI
ncbi:hypothetical protein [Bradyrhizobium sp. WSM3983]|uniref:hypothetical protein n=1 Tax=Bradyrhizobium sp. WSM3983 TaxID=1038867 RepID=UPI0012EC4104|nr:hypothetical protein [Bradyrhizobium sp. WSM3983]